MAESTLTLGWNELKQAVGFFLDFGTTIASWTAAQAATIERLVQSGVRRVHYPPAISNEDPHEWSFLRPTTTLSTVADQWNYTTELPDALGRVIGNLNFAADAGYAPVTEVPLGEILSLRSSSDRTGHPDYFAMRYQASTGDAPQRHELLMYPTPDAVYVLTYEYEAYGYELSDSLPYPLGGSQLSELFKESCLSVAEIEIMDDSEGVHTLEYRRLLTDAIRRDRKRKGKNFGQMGGQERQFGEFRRGHTGSSYPITYKSVEY